jgi:hypothetical protein
VSETGQRIWWIHTNADHRLYAAQVNIIDFIEWGRSDSKEKVQTLHNVAELTKQRGRQRYFATSSAKNFLPQNFSRRSHRP